MTIDAARDFRAAFDELEQIRRAVRAPPQGRRLVRSGFPAARCSRVLGKEPEHHRLPAGRPRRLLSPVPLHRHQSASEGAAQAGRRCRRRQRLQPAARHLSSAAARRRHRPSASSTSCWPIPSPAASSTRSPRKWISPRRFAAGPYRHSNVAAAVARCAAAADRSAVCLEDFAPYAPSRGAPIAFMAAPVIDQGVVDRACWSRNCRSRRSTMS